MKNSQYFQKLTADPSLHVQLSLFRREIPIHIQCCSWSSASLSTQPIRKQNC